ncbi:MAG: PQQ-dependent sugar dehydrogenase [Candidatus Zixiibacteriota bacterium]
MTRKTVVAGLIVLGLAASLAPEPATATVGRELYKSEFSAPVFVASPPYDSSRVMVVQLGGLIILVKNDAVQAKPFLDASGLLVAGGERGLLGLAFHPNYSSNGQFYINYTRASDGATVISQFLVGPGGDTAIPTSEVILKTIGQPESNHNGGCLQFGPDGMLYCGMGDGGGANDQHGATGNAQNPLTLLGKMIRLDVDNPPTYVPADNPWAGVQAGIDTLDEIWAFGLRNPWRFSFDRGTGDMYIGDVGQGAREEVSYEAAGSPGGLNYGWRCMEGYNCTGLTGCTCGTGLTDPITDYPNPGSNCAVTGGYVYRGCRVPELIGAYIYADYCSARFWSFRYDGASKTDSTELTGLVNNGAIGLVSSFGEDAAGEIYICDYSDGEIYRITSDSPSLCACACPHQSDFDDNGFVDATDLAFVIDVVFFGVADQQDPDCPSSRGDFNCDTLTDAVDLAELIDHVFFGQPGPCNPCAP